MSQKTIPGTEEAPKKVKKLRSTGIQTCARIERIMDELGPRDQAIVKAWFKANYFEATAGDAVP